MSKSSLQLALPLAYHEAQTYHDPQRPGFFSMLVRGRDGAMRQRSEKLEHLPQIIHRLDPTLDCWISQGEFFKRNRQLVNLWRMPLAYIDLDTYNVPRLNGRAPEFLLACLLEKCDDSGVPQPSLVIYSGRGLQVKWLFAKPVPRRALPRWQALQNELCRRLSDLGADARALDASRVLRVVETINTKSLKLVSVVHQATTPAMGGVVVCGGLVAYDFDILFDTVMPMARAALEVLASTREEQSAIWNAEKAARATRKGQLVALQGGKVTVAKANSNLRPFVPSELAWARLADIRKLAELRGWRDGAPAGERDLPLFLATCFLAQALVVPRLNEEIAELAREFAPSWKSAEIKSCVSSVVARANAAARGEVVIFHGRALDPRYRYTNDTLIERLQITPQEERQMSTIVSKDEARRRDAGRKRLAREQARELGLAISRGAWLASHESKRTSARLLRSQGESWKSIADQIGYSSPDAARMASK